METNKDWLEKFLREYEEKANKILGAYKGRKDEILNYHGNHLRSEGSVALSIAINEMLNYPEKLPSGDHEKVKAINQVRDCRKILECCNRLRTSVRQNNVRQIAYDTEVLVSLSYDAGLLKTENAILGSKRGGEREKKECAFIPLVEYAWQNSKRKTCLSMWKFLIRELKEAERQGNKIMGHDFIYEQTPNKITLYFGVDDRRKSKEIGFRSFERYVKDFKEELKKDSQ